MKNQVRIREMNANEPMKTCRESGTYRQNQN